MRVCSYGVESKLTKDSDVKLGQKTKLLMARRQLGYMMDIVGTSILYILKETK